jgi:16S rRNA U516 pseudouridylate synthase RsuA-like enzyme
MFTDEKLQRIRNGVMIGGKLVKFWAEVINKQNTNTWMHIKAYNNSLVSIRDVFTRLSLRINRIIRTDYGPFTIGRVRQPGALTETTIPKNINYYLMHRLKEKTQKCLRKLDDTKLEEVKHKMITEQRKQRVLSSRHNKLLNNS